MAYICSCVLSLVHFWLYIHQHVKLQWYTIACIYSCVLSLVHSWLYMNMLCYNNIQWPAYTVNLEILVKYFHSLWRLWKLILRKLVRAINTNAVRVHSYEIFYTKLYHTKVSLHKNFQIYGSTLPASTLLVVHEHVMTCYNDIQWTAYILVYSP